MIGDSLATTLSSGHQGEGRGKSVSIQEYGRLRWSVEVEEDVFAYMKLDVSSVVRDHKDRHAA